MDPIPWASPSPLSGPPPARVSGAHPSPFQEGLQEDASQALQVGHLVGASSWPTLIAVATRGRQLPALEPGTSSRSAFNDPSSHTRSWWCNFPIKSRN
eukprot:1160813-Pelagomonas_calceolata.AAC.21